MAKLAHNDEPTSSDQLGRKFYSQALGKLASSCQTPVTIGIYGSWGVGKTSLMKMIEKELPYGECRSVWFNAWEHQFDDAPAVALLQCMVEELNLNKSARKILTTISLALGTTFMKKVSGISADDIGKYARQYEEENFQVRNARIKVKEYFSSLVEKALNSDKPNFFSQYFVGGRDEHTFPNRVVFFIDDLDRCPPKKALEIVEAIKLHLNIPNCVFFIGVDKYALEKSIESHYKQFDFEREGYLDKLIQLPFTIPPIAPESMNAFITPLLSPELEGCKEQLVLGLGDSPRQVKRFINILTLNHELALALAIPNYSPVLLSTLLLLQLRALDAYQLVTSNPAVLMPVVNEGDLTTNMSELLSESLKNEERLKSAILVVYGLIPKELEDVFNHLHLVAITSTAENEVEDSRYDILTNKGKNGSIKDVDFLMEMLRDASEVGLIKLIDYSLDLVETDDGVQRIVHYLMNGSTKQRNYATLTLKRRGHTKDIKTAYAKGLIDKQQAFSQ